jgi:diguanylate cyclase (GGDEF)-like protein
MLKPEAVRTLALRTPAIAQLAYGSTPLAQGAAAPWSGQPLSVSIAALNFNDAHHVRIRYRLLGLEEDWVETDEENVRYPRLEPGSYRFQAELVDAVGGASSGVAELNFRITPLWWQRRELRLGLFLLAVAVLFLVWRQRVRLLVRQKQQLEVAVQKRTRDLELEKAELLRTREQLRHFAEHDDLTGLWNHRIIIERLNTEVERARRESAPLSVILADLDHFKEVNDTYGHPSGDLVLQRIGAILHNSVRSYDWVGRYGGEEFLLILPNTSLNHALNRAQQLRKAVEAVRIPDARASLRITISLGVAAGMPASYEDLIRAADTALYRAKANGRNCVMPADPESTTAQKTLAPSEKAARN